jgi:hypothetical protein
LGSTAVTALPTCPTLDGGRPARRLIGQQPEGWRRRGVAHRAQGAERTERTPARSDLSSRQIPRTPQS